MKLTELIESLDNYHIDSNLKDFEVKGISYNSKEVGNDFIFVAIKGTNQDGQRFITEAIGQGARAVVVQSRQCRAVDSLQKIPFIKVKDTRRALAQLAARFYGNPSSRMKVIGITGTNGKTTVSYLIEAIVKETGFNPAVIGTIDYRFKDKVFPAKNTTPPPLELQSLLADMLKEEVDYAIIEVSSHALHQNRTVGIDFHSAIFTNLTHDHLDYHKTLENYFQTKTKLFRDTNSYVIINIDDKYGKILRDLTPVQVITYAIENGADIKAADIKFDISHTQFRLITTKDEVIFKTRLIGRHNVYNILAAVSWALKEGMDLSIIKSAIEKFCFVPGRLERINVPLDFCIFVDYAHTEDALRNAIQTLKALSPRKIIVVFGCGGQRDKTKRPKMGYVVSELADFAIITNDNPRSEDPAEIIEDIKKGIKKQNFCIIPNREEAIRKSLSMAKSADIILVAGKGHENYQILKDEVIEFDDRKIIKKCLRSMNYSNH